MTIRVGTEITDLSWAEEHRPIVWVAESKNTAIVQMNGPNSSSEQLSANSQEELVAQLKRLSEFFAYASEVVSR